MSEDCHNSDNAILAKRVSWQCQKCGKELTCSSQYALDVLINLHENNHKWEDTHVNEKFTEEDLKFLAELKVSI